MRILALIGVFLAPACASTQKPESAKANVPVPGLSEQMDYEADIKGVCITVRELHDKLLRTNPDQLDKMGKDFWKTLNDCANLEEVEEEMGKGR
ncbi:hypothetical protein JW752_04790 [Candidatus Peregrinibacteria bacterium]|nr:hypothetical protein [Candidatus Peregrinibacteria bacterium]